MAVKVFVICGTIGAGKSTLLRTLHCDENVRVFLEPVEEWAHFLAKSYERGGGGDNDDALYMLQSLVLAHYTRVTAELEEIMATSTSATVFVERCPAEALHVFLPLNRARFRTADYDALVHMHERLVARPVWRDVAEYVVLRASHTVCMRRIQERSRSGECNITMAYLIRLGNLQNEKFVARLPPPRTHFLNSEALHPLDLARAVLKINK